MSATRKERAELCIHGYIRKNYGKISTIPVDLLQLCLELYYITRDSWSVKLSNSRYTLTEQGLARLDAYRRMSSAWPNAVGDFVIQKGEIMHW